MKLVKNNVDYELIGLRIKERRLEMGLSQTELSGLAETRRNHISDIECNVAHPSLPLLINIANALQCSVDYFIGNEYTYELEESETEHRDKKILNKLKYYDINKKKSLLKILSHLLDVL